LDFDPTNLLELKSTIENKYPDVKASMHLRALRSCVNVFSFKVTTMQADAADEAAISGVCDQALRDEGKLDVFFANVRRVQCSLLLALTNPS
jgi:hypothetical protein